MARRKRAIEVIPEHEVSTWRGLQQKYLHFLNKGPRRWLYRGQRCEEWDLRGTLERTAEQFKVPFEELPRMESELLDEFKRHLHRYKTGIPDDRDTIRWWALMQHHGAPTRLLDFTYSFYVGVFFAIESAKVGSTCAVWCFDNDWLWERVKPKLPPQLVKAIDTDRKRGKSPEIYEEVLKVRQLGVVPSNPYDLDERLAVQQGVFLMALDVSQTFSANLNSILQGGDVEGHCLKLKIKCSKKFLSESLTELQRMNITRLSLFPGIDGFAESLNHLLVMPHRFLKKRQSEERIILSINLHN